MIEPPLLGVMVLAHARPWLLRAITEQARQVDPHALVQIVLNSPTPEVRLAAKESMAEVHEYEPPVLDHREHFMEVRNWQLTLLGGRAKYACIWDDDHLLADPVEASRVLASITDWQIVYATKKYLWDTVDNENILLPTHRSPFFFQVRAGDRFPLDRTLSAPEDVNDNSTRVYDLRGPLLDVGYLRQAERERVWAAYKRAGKIDALTTGLSRPPRLRPVPSSPVLEQLRELTK